MTPEERLAWLQSRQRYAGGSDVGAIIAVSPYSSPWDIYQSKVQPITEIDTSPEELERTKAMRWGTKMEKPIAELIMEDHPDWAFEFPQEPEFGAQPFFAYDTDGLIMTSLGERRVLEIKTARWADEWGDPPRGTLNTIPETYYAQVQWGMGIYGIDKAILAASIMGAYPIEYEVDFDPPYFYGLEDAVALFWKNHVEPRIEPDPDHSKKLLEELRAKYTKDNGQPVPADEIPTDAPELASRYVQLNKTIKKMENEKFGIQNRFRKLLGERSIAEGPGFKVTWTNNKDSEVVDFEAALRGLWNESDAETRKKIEAAVRGQTKKEDGARVIRIKAK